MADIVLTNINKSFDGKKIFTGYSYTFKQGNCYLLKGESGIGKTTLINMIIGLTKADSGSIEGSNSYSVVFQEDRLLEDFSTIDNLQLVNANLDLQTISSKISTLIPGADISKPVKTFSGGMKRRLAIARAMLAKSDVVIMDEPFVGLDSNNVTSTLEFIMNNLNGRTLIVTTHVYDSLPDFQIINI